MVIPALPLSLLLFLNETKSTPLPKGIGWRKSEGFLEGEGKN
ncbi:hypothetical protein F480_00550 [Bibersteinia trehalosi Y31]|uniref:Uncharacterized protein n=1 Tax=Bibersteinia trehalosi Y31 TaxID=1261658 RepID=A0A179D2I6_BIBTR|nr:hypothetical protein F480_00550 [Bibersteinia trehalosi Y31]